MEVGSGQMPMSVLFFKYFTNGDELMALYWAGESDLCACCLQRPLGRMRHSGQQGLESKCALLSSSFAASGQCHLLDSVKHGLGMSSRMKKWKTRLN